MSIEITIEDMFLRLDLAGQDRDEIKKQWYSLGDGGSREDRKVTVLSWHKTHSFLQELL